MAEILFNILNLLPLPFWVGMLLFPQTRFTQNLVTGYWPFIVLGGISGLMLVVAVATGAGSFSLSSFDALRAELAREWGFLLGWTYYLTLNLFAAVWIFRDAKYWEVGSRLFLLLTLLTGPLGLGIYLLVRQRWQRNESLEQPN